MHQRGQPGGGFGVDQAVFQLQVRPVQRDEVLGGGVQRGQVSRAQLLQQRAQRGPAGANGHVVIEQALRGLPALGAVTGLQHRHEVAFFVLMVVRCRQFEVAQDVIGRAAGRSIGAVLLQVRDQPAQQVKPLAHPVMAGGEQLERLVEAGGGGVGAGEGGRGHAGHSARAGPGRAMAVGAALGW